MTTILQENGDDERQRTKIKEKAEVNKNHQQSESARLDEQYNFDVDNLESIDIFQRNREIEKGGGGGGSGRRTKKKGVN